MKSAAALLALVATTSTASELTIHTASWHSSREYLTGEFESVGYDWNRYAQDGKLVKVYEETRRPYNNSNLGVGYISDGGWTIGIYRNSYHRTSVYAGKVWSWKVGPSLLAGRQAEVGLMAALATGYSRPNHSRRDLQPAAGLTLGIPLTERVTVRLIGAPALASETDSVVHLTLAYRL